MHYIAHSVLIMSPNRFVLSIYKCHDNLGTSLKASLETVLCTIQYTIHQRKCPQTCITVLFTILPLFSDADLRPLQLQVSGDEVVVCVVVVDDPHSAGVGHVVHVCLVGHHRLLLHHHPCHGQEQQETDGQENIFFSEIFEIGVLSHSQVSWPVLFGNRNDNNSNDKSFRARNSVSEIWEKVM